MYFVLYNSGCDDQWDVKGPLTKPKVKEYLASLEETLEGPFELYRKIPDVEFGNETPRVVLIEGEILTKRP